MNYFNFDCALLKAAPITSVSLTLKKLALMASFPLVIALHKVTVIPYPDSGGSTDTFSAIFFAFFYSFSPKKSLKIGAKTLAKTFFSIFFSNHRFFLCEFFNS